MAHPLNVIYLGTYPPRRCGIATFTRDLAHACSGIVQGPPRIVALNAAGDSYDYPPEVEFEIRRDHIEDYRRAAEWINRSTADVLCVQHEFGIFGGPAGAHLFELLQAVEKPVVTTLHTVLKDPEPEYEEAARRLVERSDALVVLSEAAREILVSRYGAPEEKIALIYHGVPDIPPDGTLEAKRRLGFEGRFVMLTFGLLSRNKGIETAIEALPPVVEKRPDFLYIVLGVTHPEVKKREGERYREALKERVRELSLEEHVRFVDEYVDLERLLGYITASDIYITPYLGREQVSSGTLSYALAAGKVVISTPYWYAEELLADGRGVLVPFQDPGALSEAILSLIEDPGRMEAVRRAAYAFGRKMVWPEVGKEYSALFSRVRRASSAAANGAYAACNDRTGVHGSAPAKDGAAQGRKRSEEPHFRLPPVNLDHLKALTDDTGLIQHATWGVPDRNFGYSTDDVGRALVALLEIGSGSVENESIGAAEEELAPLITRYMSFLQYAQTESGHFHNFLSYDRRFLDEHGSDDTLGRAIWGLGAVVRHRRMEGIGVLADQMLQRALEPARATTSPRAWAYVICGLDAALRSKGSQRGGGSPRNGRAQQSDGALRSESALRSDGAIWHNGAPCSPGARDAYRRLLQELAERLCGLYARHAGPGWRWFEERITYGNAKMSEALLLAYLATGEPRYKRVGLSTLDFLLDLCWNGSYFDLVGNEGWMERGKRPALFGQQPIDAGYLVEACDTAYEVTGEPRYLRFARAAFAWFLGQNRLGVPLYDERTGAVADGLDSHGVSLNQGAESLISYLLALGRMRRRFAGKEEGAGERAAWVERSA